jgi:hypothetical protein
MFISTRILFRVLATLATVTVAVAAHADCVQISSLPYVISQSGAYCVVSNLSINLPDGIAITIGASDVDLDLQGHMIKNVATDTSGYSYGIKVVSLSSSTNATPQITGLTIHNGALALFSTAISATNIQSSANLLKLTIDQMTAIYSKREGIVVQGTDLTVTNNKINAVTGSDYAIGIKVMGDNSVSSRAVVQGNSVKQIYATGVTQDGTVAAVAIGMYVVGSPDILIQNNAVYNAWVPATAWSGSYAVGIMISQMNARSSARVGGLLVQDNSIKFFPNPSRPPAPNLTGIMISFPGDHAIVAGSSIVGMTTAIDASNVFPDAAPVLLLNNATNGAAVIGGVTLPQ